MAATAAVSTRAGIKILFGRHPAKLKGLSDILSDRFLDFVDLLLCIEKVPRDRVVHHRIAVLLKLLDLLFGKGDTLFLLMLEVLALLAGRAILRLRILVGQKGIHAPADVLILWLIQD